jgi:hypothetical protein
VTICGKEQTPIDADILCDTTKLDNIYFAKLCGSAAMIVVAIFIPHTAQVKCFVDLPHFKTRNVKGWRSKASGWCSRPPYSFLMQLRCEEVILA